MRFNPAQPRFLPCHAPGPEAELLLVEGDSALSSVAPLRDARSQAVLALQGKPLNAWTARAERVDSHLQYQQLAQALGLPSPTSGHTEQALQQHGRLVLLFDPDADGIHIGALLVLYVLRWLPGVIERGALWQVRPPMFELTGAEDGELQHASHPADCEALAARMAAAAGGRPPRIRRFRGLGGLPTGALREAIDPATRRAHVLTVADAWDVQRALVGRGVGG